MSGSSETGGDPGGLGRFSRARLLLAAGLLATLALLLAHAAVYWFLTDDAFISFRYARNLRQGHGLVFDPGLDRVEGYTNFLWVVLLAGCDALGLAPETAANLLSLAATLGLWGLVVRRSEEHTSELQSHSDLVCRLLLEKKNLVVSCAMGREIPTGAVAACHPR